MGGKKGGENKLSDGRNQNPGQRENRDFSCGKKFSPQATAKEISRNGRAFVKLRGELPVAKKEEDGESKHLGSTRPNQVPGYYVNVNRETDCHLFFLGFHCSG